MAKEKIINGREHRNHNGIWVTADGKYVAVDTIWKVGFSEIPSTKPAKVHTDKNGERYVKRKIRNKFYNIYIKDAVNMTLPLGFPVFLMNVEPLLNSEDRSKYPECARNVYFPWRDVLACMFSKHKHLVLSERVCPDCGERMIVFHYTSPAWTWNSLCGRAGIMTICPNCPKQVKFSLTMMN